MARAEDGRVVFVRHALPGERVVAEVTAETTSFLRADAVEVLEPSPDRVAPPCPHAGPGRCGGCDWQHVAAARPTESSKRRWCPSSCAGWPASTGSSTVEEVDGAPDGLGWRTRVRFAVDRTGRVGLPPPPLPRPSSRSSSCPIATPAVNGVGVGSTRVERGTPRRGDRVPGRWVRRWWPSRPGVGRLVATPAVDAGLVVNGRTGAETRTGPDSRCSAIGSRSAPGVFWQVHPEPRLSLTRCVLEGLEPRGGGAGGRPLLRGRPVHRAPGPGRRTGGLGGGRGAQSAGPAPTRRATPTASTRSRSCGPRSTAGSGRDRLGRAGPGRPRPGPPGCRHAGDGGPGCRWSRRPGASPTSRATRPRSPGTSGSCSMPAGRLALAAGLRPVSHDRARGAGGHPRASRDPAPSLTWDNESEHWYSQPVRGRVLVVVAVRRSCWRPACSAQPGVDRDLRHRRPRSRPAPHPSADRQDGVPERRLTTTSIRRWGRQPRSPLPTWVDHLYSCRYGYPTGSIELSVKELSSWDADHRLLQTGWPPRWARPATCRVSVRGRSRPPTARWWCARTGRCCWSTSPASPPSSECRPPVRATWPSPWATSSSAAGPATEHPGEATCPPSRWRRPVATQGTVRPTVKDDRVTTEGARSRGTATGRGRGPRSL